MEQWIAGADGTRLLARAWTAAQPPLASVLVVHGIGEHSGRYETLAGDLSSAGVSVYAYDHRGHGRSEGRRGHVAHFTDYLDDLERVVAWARSSARPPQRLFLLGHSLGGLIVLHAVARRAALAEGIMLSSPACALAVAVPVWKDALGKVASVVWPALAMHRTRADGEYLSHDPAVGPAYVADPLVHFRITARCYTEVRARMDGVRRAAAAIRLPALVFQAGDDHLVDAQATRAMVEALASTDKRLVWLEGWYHEVFNETGRAQVIEQTIRWLRDHA